MTDPLAHEDMLDRIYMAATEVGAWPRMLADVTRLLGHSETVFCENVAGLGGPASAISCLGRDLDDPETLAGFADLVRGGDSLEDRGGPEGMTLAETSGAAWLVLRNAATTDGIAFLLGRGDAAVTDADIARAVPFAAHLLRSAGLRARITKTASQAVAATGLLNLIDAPVLLVDAEFNLLLKNRAAQTFADKGSMTFRNDRLRFSSKTAMNRAREIVEKMNRQVLQSDRDRLIRLEQADGEPLLAVIEPPEALFPDPGEAPASVAAAIFVKNPQRAVPPTEAALRELHGMPPAEARFAAAFAEGSTYKEYAAQAGLSESYVRDLSKRVMARLGVKRQAELVRAIVNIAPRIGG